MPFQFDQKAVGQRMKSARKRAKLTQDQLAEKFEITKSAVSQWESGSTLPDIRPIIALCMATAANSADEILMGSASVRVSPLEQQIVETFRQLPHDFQIALHEHLNKQWELAHPGRVGPASPYAQVKKATT